MATPAVQPLLGEPPQSWGRALQGSDHSMPAAPDDPLSAMLDPAPRKKALVDAADDPLSMISGGAAPPPPPERASFLAPEGGPASSSGAEAERLGWAAFKQGITREFTGSGAMRIALPSTAYPSSANGAKDGRDVMDDGEHEQSILAPKAVDKAAAGAGKERDIPKAPSSAVFPSFRLIFGRAIIPRSALEAWML